MKFIQKSAHTYCTRALLCCDCKDYHAVPSIRRYDLYLHCAFSCAAANNSAASLGNCFATEAKRTSPLR